MVVEKQLSTGNLAHFKLCQIVKNDASVTIPFPESWAKIAIESLKEQFKRRFGDFYAYSKDISCLQIHLL